MPFAWVRSRSVSFRFRMPVSVRRAGPKFDEQNSVSPCVDRVPVVDWFNGYIYIVRAVVYGP